jgi:hypothetical protein
LTSKLLNGKGLHQHEPELDVVVRIFKNIISFFLYGAEAIIQILLDRAQVVIIILTLLLLDLKELLLFEDLFLSVAQCFK